MASARESICQNDPNFAIICSFLNRYGDLLGIPKVSFAELQTYLEETKYVSDVLIDLHVRLLRKLGKTSANFEKWERSVTKFCSTYSGVDGWEMEELGYAKVGLNTRLRILKNLLEAQFDNNNRFKDKINEIDSSDLRFLPIGRDRNGLAYWYLIDDDFNLRVYREEQDDEDAESWTLVCSNRNDLANLIGELEQMKDNPVEKDKLSTSSGDSDSKEETETKVKVEPKEDEDVKVERSEVKVECPEVKGQDQKVKVENGNKILMIKIEPCPSEGRTSTQSAEPEKFSDSITLKDVKTEPEDPKAKDMDSLEISDKMPKDKISVKNLPENLKVKTKEGESLSQTDLSHEYVLEISPVKKDPSEPPRDYPVCDSNDLRNKPISNSQNESKTESLESAKSCLAPENSTNLSNIESQSEETLTSSCKETKKTLPDSANSLEICTSAEEYSEVESTSKLVVSICSGDAQQAGKNVDQTYNSQEIQGTSNVVGKPSEFHNKNAEENLEETSSNSSNLRLENETTVNSGTESKKTDIDSINKNQTVEFAASEINVERNKSEIDKDKGSEKNTENRSVSKSDNLVKVVCRDNSTDSVCKEKKTISESNLDAEPSFPVNKPIVSENKVSFSVNDKEEDLVKGRAPGDLPKTKDVSKHKSEDKNSLVNPQTPVGSSSDTNENSPSEKIQNKCETVSKPIKESEENKIDPTNSAVDGLSELHSKKETLPETESQPLKFSDSATPSGQIVESGEKEMEEPGKETSTRLAEVDSRKENPAIAEEDSKMLSKEGISDSVDNSSKESNEIKKPRKPPDSDNIDDSTKEVDIGQESNSDSLSKNTLSKTSENQMLQLKSQSKGEKCLPASGNKPDQGTATLSKHEESLLGNRKDSQISCNLSEDSQKRKKELSEIIPSEKDTDKQSKSNAKNSNPPKETHIIESDKTAPSEDSNSEKLVSKKSTSNKCSKQQSEDTEKLHASDVKPSEGKSLSETVKEDVPKKDKNSSKSQKENSQKEVISADVKSGKDLNPSVADEKSNLCNSKSATDCESLIDVGSTVAKTEISISSKVKSDVLEINTEEKSTVRSNVKDDSPNNPESLMEGKCKKTEKVEKKVLEKGLEEIKKSKSTETSLKKPSDESVSEKTSLPKIKVKSSDAKSSTKDVSKQETKHEVKENIAFESSVDSKDVNGASDTETKEKKLIKNKPGEKTENTSCKISSREDHPSIKDNVESEGVEASVEVAQEKTSKRNEEKSIEQANKTDKDDSGDTISCKKALKTKSNDSAEQCLVEKHSEETKEAVQAENLDSSSKGKPESSAKCEKKSKEVNKDEDTATESVEKKPATQRSARKQKLCVKEDSNSLVIVDCEVSERTGRPVRSTRNKSPRTDYSTITRGAVAGRGSSGRGGGRGGGRGAKSAQKATKRQIPVECSEQSSPETDDEPVVKQAKRGRARGRGKGRNRRQTSGRPQAKEKHSEDSDETDDDLPLSKINTSQTRRERIKGQSRAKSPKVKVDETPVRKSSRPRKRKKVESDEEYQVKQTQGANKRKGRGRNHKNASTSDEDTDKELEEEEDRLVFEALVAQVSTEDELSFHTSSSESLVEESDDDYLPQKEGRNARRAAARSGELLEPDKGVKEESETDIDDDTPCCKCLKSNQPEWILLCDKCDAGYHTACLRPPLMIIPSGDWFCPPCQHTILVGKLCENLKELDTALKKYERLIKRKERLAYVGISLDNIVKEDRKENVAPDDFEEYDEDDFVFKPKKKAHSSSHRDHRRHRHRERDHEPPKKEEIFTQRSCRARSTISYKFKEFDDLIDDAIQDDVKEPPPPGISRGKDMFNIEEAEREPSPVSKKRKKRRLTILDDDDDEDDGEEYKATDDSEGSPVEEEDAESCVSSSEDDCKWRSIRTRRFGKPTRTSSRKGRRWTRYDADFVVEDDYDSEGSDGYRRSTRSATKRRICYREVNSGEETASTPSEDESSSDDSGYRRKRPKIQKKQQKKQKKKPTKRKGVMYSDESEEDEESEISSEETPVSYSGEESGPSSRPQQKKKRVSEESVDASDNSSGSDTDKDAKVQQSKRTLTRKTKCNRVLDSDTEDDEPKDDKKANPEKKLDVKNLAKDRSDSENSKNDEDENDLDENDVDENDVDENDEDENDEDENDEDENEKKSEEESSEISDKKDDNDDSNASVPCKPRGIKITPLNRVIKRKLSPEELSGEQSTIDPDSPDISQSPKVSNYSSNGNSVDEMGPVPEQSPAKGLGYDRYTPQMPPSYPHGYNYEGVQYPYYPNNQQDTYQPQGYFQPSQTNNHYRSPNQPGPQGPIPQSGSGPQYTILPSVDSRNRGDSVGYPVPPSREARPPPNPAPQYQELHPPNPEDRRQGIAPQSGFVRPDTGRLPYAAGPEGRPSRPNPPPRGSFMMDSILRPKGYGEGDDDDLSDVSDLISYVTQDS